jgi:hypothetical protein
MKLGSPDVLLYGSSGERPPATLSVAANNEIGIIRTLDIPRATQDTLVDARAKLTTMSDHQIDVLEGSLAKGVVRPADFEGIPEETVRVFITSERGSRDKTTERSNAKKAYWTSIIFFIITNIVVILVGLFAK